MASPAAEVDVDESLVHALLAEQHPDLAGLSLAYLDAGWDNSLWRLGSDLLVRLPRRALAVPGAMNELRWLPQLAPRLPLAVPSPVRIGRPGLGFPWCWSVVPWLAGRPADAAKVSDPTSAASRLGRFLRALHGVAPAEAPHSPFRSVPLAAKSAAVEGRVRKLAGQFDAAATMARWAEAVAAAAWEGSPVWIHGDLHPANLLVVDGTLSAVIDFGDLCAGDPATDVAAVWMLLPSSAFEPFCLAYGGVDAEMARRSIGWAVQFALMLLEGGLDDRPTYSAVGRATLARLSSAARR